MKFIKIVLALFLNIIIMSCGEGGLYGLEISEPSRNFRLNVIVELCASNDCQPLQGKIVNIHQYEDKAMGFQEGIKIAKNRYIWSGCFWVCRARKCIYNSSTRWNTRYFTGKSSSQLNISSFSHICKVV